MSSESFFSLIYSLDLGMQMFLVFGTEREFFRPSVFEHLFRSALRSQLVV